MMRKFNDTIITVVMSCYCVFMSTPLMADEGGEEIMDYFFAETILLEQDGECHQNMECQYRDRYCKCTIVDSHGKYCKCTIVDTSSSIMDTLCGLALYKLYFDTTDLTSGKELQRTKDELYRIYRLNREVKAYTELEMPNAPNEIIVTDSLLRRMLSSKRIIMGAYAPYFLCIGFHVVYVDFTIVPICEKSIKKED